MATVSDPPRVTLYSGDQYLPLLHPMGRLPPVRPRLSMLSSKMRRGVLEVSLAVLEPQSDLLSQVSDMRCLPTKCFYYLFDSCC